MTVAENLNMTEKNNQKKKKHIDIGRVVFVGSILLIPIIFFLVFWIYPNLNSFLLSFQREEYNSEGMRLVYTTKNYQLVFTEFFKQGGTLLIAFRNTILFYFTALLIILPVSVLMAYFVYKRILFYKFFRTVTYLPTIICSSALVILFQYTFMTGGPYEAILHNMGKPYEYPMVTNSAIYMILLYNVIFGFGPNMVVLGGAMNSISRDVLEAGEIDGCNWFQELTLLIVPMIWPTISTIIVLSVAGFLSSTGPILAMTGGNYQTQTLSFILYCYATGVVNTISQDIYYASAIGIVMTLITLPIVLALRKFLYKDEREG